MKVVVSLTITACVLYFLIGFILVKTGYITQENYNQFATIVGGVASILGLLGFVLPKFTPSDLKNVEIQALIKLSKTAEEITNKENELQKKESDIIRLELQKKEMEFLIRKASLSLFFKEQFERNESRIEEIVAENKELSKLIEESRTIKTKIEELEGEISVSQNAELLRQLIRDSKRKPMDEYELIISPFSILRNLAKLLINRSF